MTSGDDQRPAFAADAVPPGQPGTARPTRRQGGQPRRAEQHGHGHHHRDVSGGWLRPAVFGAMDGLVTNVSLISGVSGGRVGHATIVLTGLAGLAAGALSMATGEFVSVSSQNELVGAEVNKERHELETNPEVEAKELALVLSRRGVDPDLAEEVARQVGRKPEEALRMHVREELGVDHQDLPSPWVAAGASLVTFAVGALIPLLPFLFGLNSLPVAFALAAAAAFIGGGTVARITDRPFLRGALRQLALAALAAGVTWGIGHSIGGGTSA